MHAVDRFLELAHEDRFKGWPVVGEPELGPKIPWFGQTLNYQLETPKGIEDYTSIIRHFGWAVVFGVTKGPDKMVPTLCQWKPGVNQASWELPPGGIGKIDPGVSLHEIKETTEAAYLKETGLGNGCWSYLGHVMIETAKFRGAGPENHGLPAHLFLAEELESLQDARHPEPNEIMETIMVPIGEFMEVLQSGYFVETSARNCAYDALVKLKALS